MTEKNQFSPGVNPGIYGSGESVGNIVFPQSILGGGPPAPQNVVASNSLYTDKVLVTWSKVEQALTYKIFRDGDFIIETNGTILQTSNTNENTNTDTNTLYYEDTTATAGVLYNYTILSSNYTGDGTLSNSDTGSKKLTTPNLTASQSLYNNKIELSWTSVDGSPTYVIYKSSVPEFNNFTTVLIETNDTSYEDEIVVLPGSKYYYAILAKTNLEESISDLSFFVEGSTNNILNSPILSASDGTSTDYVFLVWDSIPHADSYDIYRNGSLISNTLESPYYDTTAIPGTIYTYQVVAKSLEASSAYDTDGGTTGYKKLNISGVGLTATNGLYQNKIELNWNAIEGATGYEIYRGINWINPENMSLIATVGTVFTYDDTNTDLSYNTNYYYSIRGVSVSSNTKSDYLKLEVLGRLKTPVPATPTNLSASDGIFENKVSLTWDSISTASFYKIYRDGVFIDTSTVNTYDDFSLTIVPGVQYTYSIISVNSFGEESSFSTTNSGYKKLSAPTLISVSDALHETKITLNWSGSTGATSYEIYRGTSSNTATMSLIATVDSSNLSYDDMNTDLVGNTIYFYSIKAVCALSTSQFSNVDSGSIFVDNIVAPNNLTATTAGSGGVTLNWSYTGDSTTFGIWRNSTLITTVTSSSRSYVDTTATPGQNISYQVSTTNRSGVNLYSNTATGSVKLQTPVVNASDATSQTKIVVTWSGSPGATSYEIYRGTSFNIGNMSLIATIDSSIFSYDDTNTDLLAGTTYYYAVRATSPVTATNSNFSNVNSGSLFVDRINPPTNLTATTAILGGVTLTWSYFGDPSNFTLWRNGTPIQTLSSQLRTATDTTATPGQNISYQVSTTNLSGVRLYSNTATGSVKLIAPTLISASDALYETKIVLSWTSSNGATSYQIYRGTSSNTATMSLIATVDSSNLSYDDMNTDLTVGTTYYYAIKATSVVTATNSNFSNVDSGILLDVTEPPVDNITAPTNLGATTAGASGVTLTWSYIGDPTTFKIWRNGSNIQTVTSSSRSYVDTTATPGQNISYQVSTTNLSGVTLYSNTVIGSVKLIAPTLISASDYLSETKIVVSWTGSTGASAYEIYRGTSSNTATMSLIATVGSSVFSYDDTNTDLIVGTTYYYAVRATSPVTATNSNFSNVDSGILTTPTNITIDNIIAPSNLTATNNLTTQIELSWSYNGDPTTFRIWRNSISIDTLSSSSRSYVDTTATPGQNISYQVSTTNLSGVTLYSNTATGSIVLSSPNLISVSKGSFVDKIIINWSGSTGATSYQIYRGTSSNTATMSLIATVGSSSLSYIDTNTDLISGTIYFYSIKAVCALSTSQFSNVDSGSTFIDNIVAPTNLTATTAGSNSVTLNWSYTGDSTTFGIWRNSTLITTVTSSSRSYVDTTATPGQNISYQVSTTNLSGVTLYSNTATGSIKLSSPSSLTVSGGISPTQIDLSWPVVNGAANYIIERSINDITYSQIATVTTTSYSDTNTDLSYNVNYYYRVKATCAITSLNGGFSPTNSGYLLPPVPGSFTIAALDGIDASGINLSWTPSENATSYRILRDGIPIGFSPSNLLIKSENPAGNISVSSPPYGFGSFGSSSRTFTTSTQTLPTGNSGQVTTITFNSTSPYSGIQQTIPSVEENTWYVLSVYAKGSGKFRMAYHDGTNDYASVRNTDNRAISTRPITNTDSNQDFDLTNEWKRYYFIFKTTIQTAEPATLRRIKNYQSKVIIANGSNNSTPTITLWGIQLEKTINTGAEPSSYIQTNDFPIISTFFKDISSSSNQIYTYQVVSNNIAGNTNSNTNTGFRKPQKPALLLQPTQNYNTFIEFQFANTGNENCTLIIERGYDGNTNNNTNDIEWAQIYSGAGSTNLFYTDTDVNLLPGIKYYYRARVIFNGISSDYSDVDFNNPVEYGMITGLAAPTGPQDYALFGVAFASINSFYTISGLPGGFVTAGSNLLTLYNPSSQIGVGTQLYLGGNAIWNSTGTSTVFTKVIEKISSTQYRLDTTPKSSGNSINISLLLHAYDYDTFFNANLSFLCPVKKVGANTIYNDSYLYKPIVLSLFPPSNPTPSYNGSRHPSASTYFPNTSSWDFFTTLVNAFPQGRRPISLFQWYTDVGQPYHKTLYDYYKGTDTDQKDGFKYNSRRYLMPFSDTWFNTAKSHFSGFVDKCIQSNLSFDYIIDNKEFVKEWLLNGGGYNSSSPLTVGDTRTVYGGPRSSDSRIISALLEDPRTRTKVNPVSGKTFEEEFMYHFQQIWNADVFHGAASPPKPLPVHPSGRALVMDDLIKYVFTETPREKTLSASLQDGLKSAQSVAVSSNAYRINPGNYWTPYTCGTGAGTQEYNQLAQGCSTVMGSQNWRASRYFFDYYSQLSTGTEADRATQGFVSGQIRDADLKTWHDTWMNPSIAGNPRITGYILHKMAAWAWNATIDSWVFNYYTRSMFMEPLRNTNNTNLNHVKYTNYGMSDVSAEEKNFFHDSNMDQFYRKNIDQYCGEQLYGLNKNIIYPDGTNSGTFEACAINDPNWNPWRFTTFTINDWINTHAGRSGYIKKPKSDHEKYSWVGLYNRNYGGPSWNDGSGGIVRYPSVPLLDSSNNWIGYYSANGKKFIEQFIFKMMVNDIKEIRHLYRSSPNYYVPWPTLGPSTNGIGTGKMYYNQDRTCIQYWYEMMFHALLNCKTEFINFYSGNYQPDDGNGIKHANKILNTWRNISINRVGVPCTNEQCDPSLPIDRLVLADVFEKCLVSGKKFEDTGTYLWRLTVAPEHFNSQGIAILDRIDDTNESNDDLPKTITIKINLSTQNEEIVLESYASSRGVWLKRNKAGVPNYKPRQP